MEKWAADGLYPSSRCVVVPVVLVRCVHYIIYTLQYGFWNALKNIMSLWIFVTVICAWPLFWWLFVHNLLRFPGLLISSTSYMGGLDIWQGYFKKTELLPRLILHNLWMLLMNMTRNCWQYYCNMTPNGCQGYWPVMVAIVTLTWPLKIARVTLTWLLMVTVVTLIWPLIVSRVTLTWPLMVARVTCTRRAASHWIRTGRRSMWRCLMTADSPTFPVCM